MVDNANLIKSLNYKRGALRGKLTSFENYLTKIKHNDYDADPQLKHLNIINLQLRINSMRNSLEEFEDIQTQIECLSSPSDENLAVTVDARERDSFQTSYFSVLANAEHLMANLKLDTTQVNLNEPIMTAISEASPRATSQNPIFQNSIRLPILDLPKFSGQFHQFLEFRDIFTSLVHSNDALSNVQRFHYLKASLLGEAQSIVDSIPLTDDNYSVAWNLILNRYNNPDILINQHIRSLFNIPQMTRESASSLRKISDTVTKNIRALNSLEQPTQHWDVFINYLIIGKLDSKTVREYEEHKSKTNKSLQGLLDFLKSKADLLEKIQNKSDISHNYSEQKIQSKSHFSHAVTQDITCAYCSNHHGIYSCEKFLALPIKNRIEQVKKNNLCSNCMKAGHISKFCKSSSCRKCRLKHNTLLHIETEPKVTETSNAVQNLHSFNKNIEVLLPTASVNIQGHKGESFKCRALLDSGSQSNFITQDLHNKLKLPQKQTNITIVGINKCTSYLNSKCEVEIKSICNKFQTKITCFIIPKITGLIPLVPINVQELNIPSHLKLADPQFHLPGEIDLLIGSSLFWNIIRPKQITLGNNKPILQSTSLGWVVSGPLSTPQVKFLSCNIAQSSQVKNSNVELQHSLQRFWQIEETPTSSPLSAEEIECENHFQATHRRNNHGRFVVSIPFKHPPTNLGKSKGYALKQFYSLERQFKNNPTLKHMYTEFMQEYLNLGHMSLCVDTSNSNDKQYFLPHHGVVKKDSTTTKLRVVFNGSSPSDSGWSLNALQMTGPTIQMDIFSVLVKFRSHPYAASADIEKMYRQILIEPTHSPLQSIIWRSDTSEPIQTYHLNTVTYGTTSASFLAIRCLNQLGLDFQETDPLAASAIINDFYVDDLLTGSSSEDTLIQKCKRISYILSTAHFNLRKWVSNSPKFISKFPSSHHQVENLYLCGKESSKTLGLYWNYKNDSLLYQINNPINHSITKRVILSTVAQIFDPLGMLSPCTILAKIILQNLWSLNLGWDEQISNSLAERWIDFSNNLFHLNSIHIPRYAISQECDTIELHGFSDASEAAYGACIYIRCLREGKVQSVKLLCAKSKVAPLKSLTIPKLELCGALTLARLFHKIQNTLEISINKTILWCDSTIVLCWLKISPHRLKPFVSHRISEILNITDKISWYHVPGQFNPADLLTRGLHPKKLIDADIWWQGPEFLFQSFNNWPYFAMNEENEIPELKCSSIQSHIAEVSADIYGLFSNYFKLKRIIAFCLRFFNNCQPKVNRKTGSLSVSELQNAEVVILRYSQARSFQMELNTLKSNHDISKRSSILRLSPFIDTNDLIRVGGRLKQSSFTYDKKYPILLSHKDPITKLLIRSYHEIYLHIGPNSLLSALRAQYWPTNGRNLCRNIIRNCVKCCRFNPSNVLAPKMGHLPAERFQSKFPFIHTGIDYAGPFSIKDRKGRGCKIHKCYVALFICFSTKAVHIELVPDLSSDSFIAALRRFCSRRGKPSQIFSDNGTQFVGANNSLRQLGQFLKQNYSILEQVAANDEIQWKFIPASSPHFGGLWEAGIKSVKHHMKRVMGNLILTYNEMNTMLIQIEGILNSRPLSQLSSSPDDLEPLTPAHFLIGRTIHGIGDEELLSTASNRLTRFQLIQQTIQHYWKRWAKDYISELQTRQKWHRCTGHLDIGQMVLIKEENLPPLKWRLGRVTELHPGVDSIPRVASVQTSAGVLKRALVKLCPLPVTT